ncbi:MAG TPA: rRNA maturation RNase YbeY [Pontiella sp.]
MITSILNQQAKHPVNQARLQKLTDWLGRKLEEKTAPDIWSEVCAVLVDDEGIAQPNREYFGKNRPTDVISFRYDPVPGEGEGYSGDLIINVERAMQEGTARGRTDYELALYLAHGFDHLSGAEDDTDEKRRKMRATETAWLRAAGSEDLIEGLFE